MVFSSLVFLFAYLPFTLLVYYLVPRKARNLFLFFINLVFYGWGEPMFVFLMLFNIVFNYLGGYFVDKYRGNAKRKKLFLVLTCSLDLLILAIFKYAGMLADTLNLLPFLRILQLPLKNCHPQSLFLPVQLRAEHLHLFQILQGGGDLLQTRPVDDTDHRGHILLLLYRLYCGKVTLISPSVSPLTQTLPFVCYVCGGEGVVE